MADWELDNGAFSAKPYFPSPFIFATKLIFFETQEVDQSKL